MHSFITSKLLYAILWEDNLEVKLALWNDERHYSLVLWPIGALGEKEKQ